MSRARETGFYFEPVTERLALVIEGAPFPSGEHWAHVGDPIEMTPEQARLHVSMRWPGIDPEALNVELDLGMHQLLAEPATVAKLRQLGSDIAPTTSAAYKARVESDIAKWTRVVREAGIPKI